MEEEEHTIEASTYLISITAGLTEESAYLLAPISTGPRLYAALFKHQLKTLEELQTQKTPETILEVIKPNIADIIAQKRTIQATTHCPLLAIGEISKPESWATEDFAYLTFFKKKITEKMKEVYLGKGWDYSPLCLELLAHALRKQFLEQPDMRRPGLDPKRQKNFKTHLSRRCPLVIYDNTHEPLLLERIIDLASNAIAKLHHLGFSTQEHAIAYRHIYRVAELFDGKIGNDVNPPYLFNQESIKESHARIKKIAG